MLTKDLYFRHATVDSTLSHNAEILLEKVNALLVAFKGMYPDYHPVMSSGYRHQAYNDKVLGAAKNSNHTKAQAVDIRDLDRRLAKYCVVNTKLLETLGLYCEDPRATPTWVHFQSVPPTSGKRFYIPNADAAKRLAGKPLTVESIQHGQT